MEKTEEEICDDTASVPGRRKFLGTLGKTAVGAAVAGAAVPFVSDNSSVTAQSEKSRLTFYQKRAKDCYDYRVAMAHSDTQPVPFDFSRPNNGDEVIYPNRIGSYSKGLPHLANGEVDPAAYNSLLDALRSGKSYKFELIPLAGDMKLVNPQAGMAFDIEGQDCFLMTQPPAPSFASREIAAEITENYWMAMLRDVPFDEYSHNATAQAAATDLNLFGNDFKGAKDPSGQVTPELLFRGVTAPDKVGPYLSQFWYLPCNFGANEISRKMRTVLPVSQGGAEYMTDFSSWLSVQNGITPANGDIFDPLPRYIRSGRDMGQWVHADVLFQGYFQAFLILSDTLGVRFDSGNPYNNSLTQYGFGTLGGPNLASLLCEVASRALKAVWNQKWYVHRRLRPEVFAERIDRTAFHGAGYPIHTEILNSVSTSSRLGGYLPSGNAFLPMAFPEGSPTHPSYGAGHATIAGACVTVLKAWFDEQTIIEDPMVADPTGQVLVPYSGSETLTVGGELNKIASNISLARNIAGVHWRSDATESIKLGEALAISIMKDHKQAYNERFEGFSLTKFDGTTVIV